MSMTTTPPPASPIRTIRKAQGMTVEQLAFRAKLASATVYRAERGIGRPTDDTLEAVAEVLGVSLDDLRALAPASTTPSGGGATNGKARQTVSAS